MAARQASTWEDESPRRVAARLARQAQADGTSVGDLARRLAARRRADERRIACELALLDADDSPRSTLSDLEPLLEDREPSVRAAALRATSRVAEAHFDRVSDVLVAWHGSESPALRRAAAAAAAKSAAAHRLERAPSLVRLAKRMLGDLDPVVRRTAVGATFPAVLQAYPEAAFEALLEGSTSSDARVLRDVAGVLACPAAAPLAKRAMIVLRKLATDERRPVWRAAASAMWRLGRHRPDVVRPELERWLDDDVRQRAAQEALKHL